MISNPILKRIERGDVQSSLTENRRVRLRTHGEISGRPTVTQLSMAVVHGGGAADLGVVDEWVNHDRRYPCAHHPRLYTRVG